MATFTKRASARTARDFGGATLAPFFHQTAMRPRAYACFVLPSHAPDATASSANFSFAAANRSYFAPSAICFARLPVEPNVKTTCFPVRFSNSAPTSLNANDRSAAAATVTCAAALSGAVRLQPVAARATRRRTLVLVDDRPDIFAVQRAGQ